MKNIAEFRIIGRVVRTARVGSTIKMTIAANYGYKEKTSGQWKEDPHFNTVTVFNERTQEYIEREINIGDLVHARGRIRDSSFEKHGETVYTCDRICDDFARLARKAED